MSARTVLAGLVLAVLALAAGCGRSPPSGPPELRLGRHECAECGMLVSEDRFSAACLVKGRAQSEYLYFDDIGCMLDHEGRSVGAEFQERYVHDLRTRSWTRGERAWYVLTTPELLHTPMGSAIAAFAGREAAEAALPEVGGRVLDFDSLRGARRDSRAAHPG